MRSRHLLAILALVSVQAAGWAQHAAPAPQKDDGKVAASIRDAVAGGKLTRIEGGDYKIENSVRLPGTVPPGGSPSEIDVLYQIGISPKDNSPIFLPVRTAPADSADTAKRIDEVLSQMNMSTSAAQIQVCAGERTCAKVCGTGPGEYCCKWKCEKSR